MQLFCKYLILLAYNDRPHKKFTVQLILTNKALTTSRENVIIIYVIKRVTDFIRH